MSLCYDGKALSKIKKQQIMLEVSGYQQQGYRVPGLAVILVGNDGASRTYVANKEKACINAGFKSQTIHLDENCLQEDVEAVIDQLNLDPTIDGILIQLPLPDHLDSERLTSRVLPDKDVDGFTAVNVGRLHLKKKTMVPCTPKGIIALLDHYQFQYSGKRALVIGRSNLVGRPIAQLLLDRNMTVTVAHSKTADIGELALQSDLIVAAVGQPYFVKETWVRPGAVLIDVGIHRTLEGIVGDIDPACYPKAAAYTPVPGGVGPMTIVSLLENTLYAYRLHERID